MKNEMQDFLTYLKATTLIRQRRFMRMTVIFKYFYDYLTEVPPF